MSGSSSTAAVSSQDESVVILTKSSDDITSVKVSNEHGEYSVNKSESGKSTWSIPELGTLNANATAEASMISNLDGLKKTLRICQNTVLISPQQISQLNTATALPLPFM